MVVEQWPLREVNAKRDELRTAQTSAQETYDAIKSKINAGQDLTSSEVDDLFTKLQVVFNTLAALSQLGIPLGIEQLQPFEDLLDNVQNLISTSSSSELQAIGQNVTELSNKLQNELKPQATPLAFDTEQTNEEAIIQQHQNRINAVSEKLVDLVTTDPAHDPRTPVVFDYLGSQLMVTSELLSQLIDDFNKQVITPLRNGSVTDRDRARQLDQYINDIRQNTFVILNSRIAHIENQDLQQAKKDFEQKTPELAELRKTISEPTPTSRNKFRTRLIKINKLVNTISQAVVSQRQEIKTEVEGELQKIQEYLAQLQQDALDFFLRPDQVTNIAQGQLKIRLQRFFDSLSRDPEKLLNNVGLTRLRQEIEFITNARNFVTDPTQLDALMSDLAVKYQDSSGNEVTAFPQVEHRAILQNKLNKIFEDRKKQLEAALTQSLSKEVTELIEQVDRADISLIKLHQDDPKKVQYETLVDLNENLNLAKSKLTSSETLLIREIEQAQKKINFLLNEYTVNHPEYLSDESLLNLMFKNNINAYDYPGWRQTNKNSELLIIRNEWMNRTESIDEDENLTKSRLKVRYVLKYFQGKLIEGKQYPEIDEDEVLPTLKNALTTKQKINQGLALALDNINPKNGVSVRDMMWFLAKSVARQPGEVGVDPRLNYANMSDNEDTVAVMAEVLAKTFPDSEGFTQENRDLAIHAAIMFRFLTAALVELMRQTQTAGHKTASKEDSLLIENIFKYGMHVILRYFQPEHPWVELLMFLKEIPADWGPSDPNMHEVLHFRELIIDYYKCFGPVDAFVGEIQSPGFMKPLFPNMLELSGLMPNETLQVGDKIYAGGNIHFADVKEYFEQINAAGETEKIVIKRKASDTEMDFDPQTGVIVPLTVLERESTGQAVGFKRKAQVMNGGTVVNGHFEFVRKYRDIDEETGEVIDEKPDDEVGKFFITATGQRLRVHTFQNTNGSLYHLVGEFTPEGEQIPGNTYYTVKDLTLPRYFKNGGTDPNGVPLPDIELTGAYMKQDEYGIWIYDQTGKVIGGFNDGKIWEVSGTDARMRKVLAKEIGYQSDSFSDLNGNDIKTKKQYFAKGTEISIGEMGDSVQVKRTIRFFNPKTREVLMGRGAPPKLEFRRNNIAKDVGEAIDIHREFGHGVEAEKRAAQIAYEATLPPEKRSIQPRRRYEKVAYVDKNWLITISLDGATIFKGPDHAGRVTDATGNVIGKINNDNLLVDDKGRVKGFTTYVVRAIPDDEDTEAQPIGFVYPEIYDKNKNVLTNLPQALRALGVDADRKLKLDGFVNTFEKMEVARGAYEELLKSLPEAIGPIDPEALVSSSQGDKSIIHKFFAGWLGKIKMQDGPHMEMYGALTKYMIFRWLQQVEVHVDKGRNLIQQQQQILEHMNVLWKKIYDLFEGMLNDTGLSSDFRIEVEEILQWMVDLNNHYRGEEGMNMAFTKLYWRTEQGRLARVRYLDKYWEHENKPNPFAKDGKGLGEGFGLLVPGDDRFALYAMQTSLLKNEFGDFLMKESVEEYLHLYQTIKNEKGISALPTPFKERLGAAKAEAQVKEDTKKK